MIEQLAAVTWPGAQLGEALQALARQNNLPLRPVEIPVDLAWPSNDREALDRQVEATAAWLGIEAESIEAPYTDIEPLLSGAAPALLYLPDQDGERLLALTGPLTVLGPDLALHGVSVEVVGQALRHKLEVPIAAEIDRLMEQARIPAGRQARARSAILRERLGSQPVRCGWLLRAAPNTTVWNQIKQARLIRRLLMFAGVHALQYGVWLASWWMIGSGALNGRLDIGWLMGWALLLLTLAPLRMGVVWLEGRLAVSAGGLIKQRLLYGALRLEPDEIRHQGVGQLLGRVIESEAVESLALSGGFLTLLAGIEIVFSAFVLGAGANGQALVGLLLGWLIFTGWLTWRLVRQRGRWTTARLDMTHELVERMVGHRTRVAQESREHWHDGEDQALARYFELSSRLDRTVQRLMVIVLRGWIVLGTLGLAPAILSGQGSEAALAIGVGGVVSVYAALRKLVGGLSYLAGAGIAWQQIEPIFQAAGRPETIGKLIPAAVNSTPVPGSRQRLIDMHAVTFRYLKQGEPVLQKCGLQICTGDQVLLEGPSGGGKSTLAALLIGLRRPQSGLILLDGLDRATLGDDGWRRRVAAAPQFHENHVLTETFAFNLLMGRGWPPTLQDLEDAETLCRELGLGDLLDHMPAGILQMVGEGGWQLSHGERSRLYIARGLLQRADLVILDESFAALDPETLQQALGCVLKRAATLLVIAHP